VICPLCRIPGEVIASNLSPADAYRVTCPRCGTFEITDMAVALYEHHASRTLKRNRYLLSGRARAGTLGGRTEHFDVDDFAAAEKGQLPEKHVEDKIQLMLGWFKRNSPSFGEWVMPESSTDYPVAYCQDSREWTDLIWALVREGWLEDQGQQFRITLAGRRKLESQVIANAMTKESNVFSLPAHFAKYQPDVERFLKDGAFEDSVFVMMRFPDARTMSPDKLVMLEAIFKTIRDELARYGLNARRADDKTYATDRQLWDNLCVYMLGCKYGLAVLEDRSGDELNPNVTLEYGFMRALGRDAVLVKEHGFQHIRADLLATIPKEFSIAANLQLDEQSLRAAVESWMIDLGRPARRKR
jgi:hypothetical protein